MRIFLDANFLVAAGFNPDGDYREALSTSKDTFVVSEHILTEAARNLERIGRDPKPFIAELRAFAEITDRFDLLPTGLPLQGSGDRQALAEAIGSGCDRFITSDTDFADLFGQEVKGVLVEKSAAYVRRIFETQT